MARGRRDVGDGGWVFTTRLGDPMDPRNFHRDFKLRVAKAGVPVVPIHSTRRTCASLLVALDVHPRVAMAVLRHSRISVTMEVYSQASSASTRDALKRLGGAVGRPVSCLSGLLSSRFTGIQAMTNTVKRTLSVTANHTGRISVISV